VLRSLFFPLTVAAENHRDVRFFSRDEPAQQAKREAQEREQQHHQQHETCHQKQKNAYQPIHVGALR
jgi:hypothetical protein